MCNLGDGSTDVTFWKDIWAGDVLAQKFPRLFSFARDENVSIRHLMHAEDLDTLFSLPMSPEVFEELIQLQMILSSIAYDLNENDQWILDWGNQVYSFRQYYQMVFQNYQASAIFKELWKCKCTPRIKIFMWLLLVDRLNTRSMLVRRNYYVQPNVFCVMCNGNVEEDIDHLFFSCPFASTC